MGEGNSQQPSDKTLPLKVMEVTPRSKSLEETTFILLDRYFCYSCLSCSVHFNDQKF